MHFVCAYTKRISLLMDFCICIELCVCLFNHREYVKRVLFVCKFSRVNFLCSCTCVVKLTQRVQRHVTTDPVHLPSFCQARLLLRNTSPYLLRGGENRAGQASNPGKCWFQSCLWNALNPFAAFKVISLKSARKRRTEIEMVCCWVESKICRIMTPKYYLWVRSLFFHPDMSWSRPSLCPLWSHFPAPSIIYTYIRMTFNSFTNFTENLTRIQMKILYIHNFLRFLTQTPE